MTEVTLLDVFMAWVTPVLLVGSISRFRASRRPPLPKLADHENDDADQAPNLQGARHEFQPAHPPHLQSPNADEAKTVSDEGRPGQ